MMRNVLKHVYKKIENKLRKMLEYLIDFFFLESVQRMETFFHQNRMKKMSSKKCHVNTLC